MSYGNDRLQVTGLPDSLVFSVSSVVNAFSVSAGEKHLTQRTQRTPTRVHTNHGRYGPHSSYIPTVGRRRHRALGEVSPRAAPRGSRIFRPSVSPRALLHAGG